MTPPAFGLVSRRGSIGAALLLLISACDGAREFARPEAASSLPTSFRRFFSVAYQQISDKYVTEMPAGDLADSGIANLRKLDSSFEAQSAADKIDIRYNGALLASFQRPAADDNSKWAELTVAAIEAGRMQSAALRNADTEALYKTVLDGAITRLDTFSRYSGRDITRESRASRDGFGGIGVTIDGKDGKIRIGNVIEGAPASREGVQADDYIVKIEGEPVTGDVSDVTRRLRGKVGEPVSMTVDRGSAQITFRIIRAFVIPPSITYRRIANIAHIRMSSFNQRTTDALADSIKRAKREMGADLEGIVLDLRGNLGGLLDQAISVADLFLAEGSISATRGRHRSSSQTYSASRGDVGEGIPLVLLVNGASASASEIVAAALEDNGRAVLVGTTTFGKGSVQTVIPMPNDGEMAITWAKFFSPTGYPIADLGVMPTVCTSGGVEAVSMYLDARAGKLATPAALSTWRSADHNDLPRIKQLRTLCPPETRDRDVDMEVARSLLGDRSLYARVLQSVTLAAQARIQ